MSGTNKYISILGAGESGVGAAILAQKQGWNVFVSDFREINIKFKNTLEAIKVEWEEGQHSMDRILKSDVVVKSPGIADTVKSVLKIKEAGIPVISEIEFAGQ